MTTRKLPVPASTVILAITVLIAFVGIASSTTIVSVISKSGIVLLSDSETSLPRGAHESQDTTCGFTTDTKKVFVIQDRWGISASDSACFHLKLPQTYQLGNLDFEFGPWIHNIERDLPKDISFSQFTKTIRDKFSELVPKLQVAVFMTSGGWGEPQNPAEMFESMTTFSITGYDNGIPRLAIIKCYVDWRTRTVLEPYIIPIQLRPIEVSTNFNYLGIYDAAANFLDGESYAHQQALLLDAKTFTKFFSHTPPTLDDSVAIARVLIQIEEKVSPNEVGGAIGGVKITPDGRAVQIAYALPKPKTDQKKNGTKTTSKGRN